MKANIKRNLNFNLLFLFLCSQLLLSACSVAYKSTGDIMLGFAEDQGVPYMLTTDDVALGCAMSEAFTPFLLSFSRVTTPPDQLAVLFYLVAGNCSEFKAWEEELRYLRAIHAKNASEAQDARIAQQRLLSQAAHRQYTGYRYLILAFAEPGGECPDLDSDRDQLYWLVGLMNGVLAVINDLASEGLVNVPLDTALKTGRGATCLDNEKWWGLPNAIQAAILATIPGEKPAGTDPLEMLDQSMQTGLQQGMLVPQVLAAQVYMGLGNTMQVKKIIRRYPEMKTQPNKIPEYRILNEIAILQLQAISDRLWTEATGKRTPLGALGTFWDDQKDAVDTIDIDDIL